MALKFEFTVSEADAQNIMDQLRKAQVEAMLVALSAEGQAATDWWRNHAQYWKDLTDQIITSVTKV